MTIHPQPPPEYLTTRSGPESKKSGWVIEPIDALARLSRIHAVMPGERARLGCRGGRPARHPGHLETSHCPVTPTIHDPTGEGAGREHPRRARSPVLIASLRLRMRGSDIVQGELGDDHGLAPIAQEIRVGFEHQAQAERDNLAERGLLHHARCCRGT